MVHLLILFIGLTGRTGGVGLAVRAGFVCFAGIYAIACFTGLVDVAGLAGLSDLIDVTGFASLLALSAFFLSEYVELPQLRSFLVAPPGWWGAVAGLPGVEADQVGAAGCELFKHRVCFGGGEVGVGQPAVMTYSTPPRWQASSSMLSPCWHCCRSWNSVTRLRPAASA